MLLLAAVVVVVVSSCLPCLDGHVLAAKSVFAAEWMWNRHIFRPCRDPIILWFNWTTRMYLAAMLAGSSSTTCTNAATKSSPSPREIHAQRFKFKRHGRNPHIEGPHSECISIRTATALSKSKAISNAKVLSFLVCKHERSRHDTRTPALQHHES